MPLTSHVTAQRLFHEIVEVHAKGYPIDGFIGRITQTRISSRFPADMCYVKELGGDRVITVWANKLEILERKESGDGCPFV